MTYAALAPSGVPARHDAPLRPAPRKSPPRGAVDFPAPRPNRALMSVLGLANRHVILRGWFRLRDIDLPAADRQRLQHAVNRDTAAFLAPNHAEFGLDWMLDKEISTMVAPRMAAWASHDIIRGAPWFWARNNLVSNRGGARAMEYSVLWALAGNGVLLHPEGMVRWTSDVVHPLFGGVADMALEAAVRAAHSHAGRPVYIVPLVWKLRYTRDVSAGLHADMAHIERSLGLPLGDDLWLTERFRQLHENVLAMQMTRFGFDAAAPAREDFFTRQEAFRAALLDDLLSRYPVEPASSPERTLRRLARTVTDPHGRARIREAERLGGFSREVYDIPSLTQEHLHECLKRIRADLVTRGAANALHNFLPKPHGPRVAHIRVAEPLLVSPVEESERQSCVEDLLDRTRQGMQDALDAINRQIAPDVDAWRRPNPFYSRGT